MRPRSASAGGVLGGGKAGREEGALNSIHTRGRINGGAPEQRGNRPPPTIGWRPVHPIGATKASRERRHVKAIFCLLGRRRSDRDDSGSTAAAVDIRAVPSDGPAARLSSTGR